MRNARLLLLSPLVALAACMPHPPPAPPPPQVNPQTAIVTLDKLPAAAVARYLGTYRSGGDSITIRRAADALYADRNGASATTPLALVGLGTFADAGGTAYLFVPVDGSGGKLRTVAADGTSRDWVR